MKSNCSVCGARIDGNEYNPYNVSFERYQCQEHERKMCKKCAEKFVAQRNRCKGGHWVLENKKEETR